MSNATEARQRIKARRAAKANAATATAKAKAKAKALASKTKSTEITKSKKSQSNTLEMPTGAKVKANLPDNGNWENRFEVRSASSDRVYIIAQSKDKRHWGCSCMGWRRHRKCKHLTTVGLPCFEEPHEVQRLN